MNDDYQIYMNNVSDAISLMLAELEKKFPGISLQQYESGDEPCYLHDRMAFGLYFEFIKMGINPCSIK